MKRGDVYYCDLGADPRHGEAAFRRPVLLVSADRLHRVGLAVVVAITRTRRDYPSHVELDGVLPVVSYIQCEQVRTLSTDRLIRLLGHADPATLARVDATLRTVLDLRP